jgi:hypothetical protein
LGGLGSFVFAACCAPGNGLSQPENILRYLSLSVANDKGYSTVEGVYDSPPVTGDSVIDPAADRMLDVGHPDAQGMSARLRTSGLNGAELRLPEEQPDVLMVVIPSVSGVR